MKFRPLKLTMSEDKTRLQPSRHFFFFSQANQLGQTLTM
jgi:hydroxyacyl-ACP dehydratase HTD2-like protein with hotdog domain